MKLPERILFVDVETTGLGSNDRVVTLGLLQMQSSHFARGNADLQHAHLIFDPGRKSHPRAEEKHGWSDWVLRHQEPFAESLPDIEPLFTESGLIVAHNADFDIEFLRREFAHAGCRIRMPKRYCTMEQYRRRYGSPASLDAASSAMGMYRSGATHGALEDAWLALHLFLWLNDLPRPSPHALPLFEPTNLKEAPPPPIEGIPRRRKGEKPTPTPKEPIVDPYQRDTLLAAARQTAIMMMWVVRSKGSVEQADVMALMSMVRDEAKRLGTWRNEELIRDVVRTLAHLRPAPDDVDDAARIIIHDPGARGRLGSWVRSAATAVGAMTEDQRVAVARLTEAFRRLAS